MNLHKLDNEVIIDDVRLIEAMHHLNNLKEGVNKDLERFKTAELLYRESPSTFYQLVNS